MLHLLSCHQGREVHPTPLSSNSHHRNCCLLLTRSLPSIKGGLSSAPGPLWDSFTPSPQSLFSSVPSSHWFCKHGSDLLGLHTSPHPCPSACHCECMEPRWESGTSHIFHVPPNSRLCSFHWGYIMSAWAIKGEFVLLVLHRWLVGTIQSTNHSLIHFTFRILYRMTLSSHFFFITTCYGLNVYVSSSPNLIC